MESIVDSLHDILANIEIDGDFAASGVLDPASNPGLHVEGLGDIGLPVSQRDLEALVSKSKQSGFGFKSETRIDLNVRKTWEIQADQVRFDHPSWPTKLRQIIDNVSTALRVPMGVEAKLNKLLIYEKGGKFDKHKDSEKENGMFGTLVITLPMKHKGGDILLEHQGLKKVFKSAPTSSYGMSYMAWYADVLHEVCEVESGNRIALTYNLTHALGPIGLSELERDSDLSIESDLHRLLTKMKGLPEARRLLAYQLDHEYTEANMRLDHLKGLDRKRFEMLYSAAKASDFSMFLASMEKRVHGACEDDEWEYDGLYEDESDQDDSDEDESEDGRPSNNKSHNKEPPDDDDENDDFHKIVEVCDKIVSLRKVFDLDGHKFATGVEIREDQVVQGKKAFKKIDDEDYSGWTGNEGVSTTHYYRSTVMILIPRVHEVEAFFEPVFEEGKAGIDRWLQRMIEGHRIAGPNQRVTIGEKLENLVSLILQRSLFAVQPSRSHSYFFAQREAPVQNILNGNTLNLVAMAALAINNDALLLEILHACNQIQPSMWHILGHAIQAKTILSTQTNFAETLEKHDLQAITDIIGQLSTTLAQSDFRNDDIVVQHTHKLVQDYLQITLERRLETKYRPIKKDGIALATLCSWYPKLVEKTIFPFVSKNKSNSAFTISFLAAFRKRGLNAILDLEIELTTVEAEVIESLNIISSYCLHDNTEEVNGLIPEVEKVSPADLANVLFHRIENDHEQSAQSIVTLLLEAASHAQETIFRDTLFPMLNRFLPLLKAMITAPDYAKTWNVADFVRTFLSQMLEQYIVRHVKEEPTIQPSNLKRTGVGCGCEDCTELDGFLTSATESIGRFPLPEKRRGHLEHLLRTSPDDYKLDTERSKSPYKLVVKKGKDLTMKERDAWMVRRKGAQKLIKKLQHEGLSTVMGEDDIEALLRIGLATNRPLGETHANQRKPALLGPGAGSKHRLDEQEEENPIVVDLT